MGRWADIRTRVVGAVGDITSLEAQTFALDAAMHLSAEARFYEAKVTIGTTVAGTAQYDLPESVVDIYSVLVDGAPYEKASPSEIEQYDAGRAWIVADRYESPTGVFCEGFSSTGDLKLDIRPAPEESGLTITGRRILPIAVSNWSTEDPPLPSDFDKDIVQGATALGLMEKDDRFAEGQQMWDRFESVAVRRLRSRKSGRVGKGAVALPLRRH